MTESRPIDLRSPDLPRWQPGNIGSALVWRFHCGVPGPR